MEISGNLHTVSSVPERQESPETMWKLSEIFCVGSALCASAAVAVGFLSLVGRVSFIKPFTICLISAIAFSVLEHLFKGIDVTGDQLFNYFSLHFTTQALYEGSEFEHEGIKYRIVPTVGDGACGAHAVLGTVSDDLCKYTDDVRKYFTDKLEAQIKQDTELKKRWEEGMVVSFQDFLSGKNEPYAAMVFNALDTKSVKDAVNQIHEKQRKQKTAQKGLFIQAYEDKKVKEYILNAVRKEETRRGLKEGSWVEQLQREEFVHAKIGEFLQEVISELGDNALLASNLTQNLQALQNINEEETTLYRQFVQKPEVLNAYIQGVLTSDYYFSEQDIGLMAYLFNKRIKMYKYDHTQALLFCINSYGDNPEHEEKVIINLGNHYSLCQRVS